MRVRWGLQEREWGKAHVLRVQTKAPVAQPTSSAGTVPAPRVGADSTDLSREGWLLAEQVTILSNLGAASRRDRASSCSTDIADLSRAAGDL